MVRIRKRNTQRIQTLWKRIIENEKPGTHHYDPAEGRTHEGKLAQIARHGKKFLETFRKSSYIHKKYHVAIGITTYESAVGMWLYHQRPTPHPIGRIKLGFQKDTVIMESIHGTAMGSSRAATVKKELGKRWDDFALEIVEEHARKAGYTRAAIRDPRAMHWYRNPLHDWELPEQADAIRRRMDATYRGIARRHGYHLEGNLWVKDL